MKRFFVIGLDDNPDQSLSEEILSLIAQYHVFSGGKRHYELIKKNLPANAHWIQITAPVSAVAEAYREHNPIVVFASGDPLFFGFATTIKRFFPDSEIVLYPSFNSLQMLAHRILMPYQNMKIVSLTGRPWHEFDRALIENHDQIGILTDHVNTPCAIAQRMLHYGYDNYRITIGEHLGNPGREKVRCFDLEDIGEYQFSFPNCIILEKKERKSFRRFGLSDAAFEHLDGREKMITKLPVRLLSLQMAGLHACSEFWDIGFCTGSVSIEAKLGFPHLHVTAFEIREAGKELMEINSRRFGAPGIDYRIADFCEADISSLSCPDAVFIGGHGGKLPEIIKKIKGALAANGCIIFNSVSEESLLLFENSIARVGMKIQQQTTVKVDDHNPITICKAVL